MTAPLAKVPRRTLALVIHAALWLTGAPTRESAPDLER
jgi:hypothetical protein